MKSSNLRRWTGIRRRPADNRVQLLLGTVGSLAVKALSMVINFAVPLAFGRALGASEYGTYAYSLSWAVILSTTASLGLDVLLVREVPSARERQDWASLIGVIRWSFRFVLVVAVALLTVVAVGAWGVSKATGLNTQGSLLIALVMFPLLSLARLQQGALQGLGQVVAAQLPQMILLPALLLVSFELLVHVATPSASLAALSYMVAALVSVVAAAVVLRRSLREVKVNGNARVRAHRWLLSVKSLFLLTLVSTINGQVGVLTLGAFGRPEAAGIFDVARRASNLVNFPVVAVGMAFSPMVASLYARGERGRLQKAITFAARVALALSVPIGLVFLFFGRSLLPVLGTEFAKGTVPLAILVIGELLNVALGPAAQVLNMTGHERETLLAAVYATVANIALSLLLVPRWGAAGAALGTTVSLAVWSLGSAIRVGRSLGLDPTTLGWVRRNARGTKQHL